MSTAQALLRQVEAAGGQLIRRGDDGLRVQAPAPLPDDLVADLRQHKGELLSLLAEGSHVGGGAASVNHDRLAVIWGAETARLIRWFQTTTPLAQSFELMRGVTIADPGLYWAALRDDIEAGPQVARGLAGTLAADLRRLHERFGQAPRDPGADHGDDDIERAAIQEFDDRPGDGNPAATE